MIIERLSQEHRNIEKLLAILERELEVFDRGDRPDYEVIRAVISYFEVYPEVYHHPQEDLVFAKLRTAVTTTESDLAGGPCDDLTRIGGIPGIGLRQYAGRHDRHASDSAKMVVLRLEAR